MSPVNAAKSESSPLVDLLAGVRILLVGPSLAIMGGQAVQADLLYRNFKNEQVAIGFLPINPLPWGPLKYLTRIKYLRTLIVSIFYLASLLLTVRKYDVIHIFSASYFSFILAPTPALLVSRLCGKKTILNYRSGEAEDHLSRSGRLIFGILRLADRIVTPSSYLVDVFARFELEATPVYNISDTGLFKYRERTQLKPHLIVARNLEPLYDVATAIKAFAAVKSRYSEAELTIVGEGSELQRLRRLAAELELSDVHFTGRVERSEIARLFEEADLFLNSSVIDNMPVAIIEAFYAGLPVVTSNAGGIPYFVQDGGNGLVVAKGDSGALAQAVLRVVEDAELRRRLVAGGRRTARECSWDAVKLKWAKIYRSLAPANE